MNGTKKRHWRFLTALVLAVVVAMTAAFLGGCTTDDAADDTSSDSETASEGGTIMFGYIPWDEDIAATYLWKALLEEEGYDVELTQLDVAPVFDGLAAGDLDLFLDSWLPVTHSDYWEEYGDQIEDITVWYDNGLLTWAVPDYVDVDSIADLADNADLFDATIVGIEPGSGLMRMSRESVMPGYGLEDYNLVEGSTPAMLAELDRAISDEEAIIVTLWRPHWAYGVYPLKDLEDPEGLLGEAEEIHVLARGDFSADFPDVAEWLSAFTMNDDQLASLENLVINEYGAGQEEDAVAEWLSDDDNRALADSWLGK